LPQSFDFLAIEVLVPFLVQESVPHANRVIAAVKQKPLLQLMSAVTLARIPGCEEFGQILIRQRPIRLSFF
jgi:hypothetical protein